MNELICRSHVLGRAKKTPEDVCRVIDEFAWENWMMNIGDGKGLFLDDAVQKAQPQTVLEFGTFIGYSSLRMARNLPPGAHIYTLEVNPHRVQIARSIIDHAGCSDRITVLEGSLNDHYMHLDSLFGGGRLDFVFFDHVKDMYLNDLLKVIKWLHPGSVCFADNVLYPGAPEYRKWMHDHPEVFETTEHETMLEYSNEIQDMVTVSIMK